MMITSLTKTCFGLRSARVLSSSWSAMAASTILFCIAIMIIEVDMINVDSKNPKSSSSSSLMTSLAQKTQQHRQALKCCQKVPNNDGCRQECLKQIGSSQCSSVLANSSCNQKKVDALDRIENACGKPFMEPDQDEVWTCLMVSGHFNTDHDPNELNDGDQRTWMAKHDGLFMGGMNPAKYLCCKRAIDNGLRKICYKAYSDHFDKFRDTIEELGVRFKEEQSFYRCLDDSEHHCQYGCETRLQFCRHFQHFRFPMRNCNREADQKAKQMFAHLLERHAWSLQHSPPPPPVNGQVSMQESLMKLHAWKSIHCAINLQPCLPEDHYPMPICSNHCDQLKAYLPYQYQAVVGLVDKYSTCGIAEYWLNEAQNYHPQFDYDYNYDSGLDSDHQNFVDMIMTQHSPKTASNEHQDLCLNLSQTMPEPKEESDDYDDDNPRPSEDLGPCSSSCYNDDEIHPKKCIKNRDCFVNDCPEFRCINQCTIGKLSETRIPQETMVRIPMVLDHSGAKIHLDHSDDEHCYHQCYCDAHGSLADCYFHCLHGPDQFGDDQWTQSLLDRITCSFQCSQVLEPICAWPTGITYPNHCFYECFHDAENDDSSVHDGHCKRIGNNLKTICLMTRSNRSRCVWDDSVQLFPLNANVQIAHQSLEQVCSSPLFQEQELNEPNFWLVCDTNGTHHPNPCGTLVEMAKNHRVFPSHLGQCQVYCSMSGPVYGRDRTIYHTECAAQSHGVLVDHFDLEEPICAVSGCPHTAYAHRLPFNHCQYCGSIEYFVYNPNHFDRITNTIDSDTLQHLLIHYRSSNMLTLVKQLRSLLSINVECELFAHLFTPGLVQVLIKPSQNVEAVSIETLDTCQKELQRLTTLIVNRSPMIELQFPVGLLRYNQTVSRRLVDFKQTSFEAKDDSRKSSKSNPKPNLSNPIMALLLVVVVMHRIKFLF